MLRAKFSGPPTVTHAVHAEHHKSLSHAKSHLTDVVKPSVARYVIPEAAVSSPQVQTVFLVLVIVRLAAVPSSESIEHGRSQMSARDA